MATITPSHQMPFPGIVMKMLIPPPAPAAAVYIQISNFTSLASVKMVRSLLGWWSLTTGFISFLRSQIMLEETV